MQLKGIQRKNQILVATTVFLSPIPSIDVMAMTVLNSLMIKEIKSIWGCNWSPEFLDRLIWQKLKNYEKKLFLKKKFYMLKSDGYEYIIKLTFLKNLNQMISRFIGTKFMNHKN